MTGSYVARAAGVCAGVVTIGSDYKGPRWAEVGRMDGSMAQARPSRSPSWYGIVMRVGVVTFIGTLLCFAVSLLLAIVGITIISTLRHMHPDMRIAYRLIALPVALVAGSIVLVLALGMEIRHYRQSKTLSAIERLG